MRKPGAYKCKGCGVTVRTCIPTLEVSCWRCGKKMVAMSGRNPQLGRCGQPATDRLEDANAVRTRAQRTPNVRAGADHAA